MKNFILYESPKRFLLFSCAVFLMGFTAFAQNVNVNNAHPSSNGTYPTLNAAFNAINSQVQTGNDISVEIVASTTETTSATLTNGDWNSLRVFPSTTGITVDGSFAAPLIDLNGANNVTLDGRVNGVSSGAPHALTLRNINTSATVGNSTIRFINGASNDTIQYVRIEGSTTASTSGVIFLSTSTAPAGNNDNVIQHNLITNAGGNRAVNTLYSLGTAAKFNTGNKFENNEVFDFFRQQATSQGILIAGNNTEWTIRNNSFYETGTLAPTTTTTYTAIHLNSANIVNSVVSGNFIGGSQALAGGSAFTKTGNNNTFYGIRLSVGTSTVSAVDSNFITNMSWSNSSSAEWYGIRIDAGLVEVGSTHGNTIGAATGTGSIYLEGGGTSFVPSYYGISTASTGNVKIENNIIASITTNRSNQGYATQFFGIHRTAGSTTNIENNTIGSATQANSIWSQSISNLNASATAQAMYGIYNTGTGTLNVIGNTIANLTNATTNPNVGIAGLVQGITSTSTSGTNLIQNNNIHNLSISSANNLATTSASLAGIMLSGSSIKSVRENNIYNLTNSFTDFAGHIYGIHFLGNTGTGNGAFRNFIHSLNVPNNTNAVAATIYGIRMLSGGVASIENNIISLDNDNTTLVYGIFDNATAGTSNIYHNTVYLGGNPTSGSANSFGLWANAVAGIQDYRNNIFSNLRVGGSGSHYAIGLSGTSALTINNNAYFVSNTGVTGYLTSNQNTLADWKAATGQDDFSIDTDPDFDNAGGLAALDYMPDASNLFGNLFLGVTQDYSGAARSTFSMGAYDVALDVIVTVNSTLGLPTDNYVSLKDAFDKINDGTHQGEIQVQIHEGHAIIATALLNASGIGAADYTSVRVYPTDENVLVSANFASPMIDLNGANNVTIDGRVNGVSSGNPHALTLRNSNGLTTAGNSTIRFINGASNDTIQYVRIEGSTTATASGVIFLSTSTAPAGNNDNVIQHNLITNAGGNRAVNSLYSFGTAAKFNTGNKFENNEVFDFFRQQAASQGILIAGNNTEWTIRNNSFYETGTLNPTTTTTYTAIYLNSANIVNSVVSGNFIGGSQALAGGSAFTKSGNNTTFYGIRLSVGTTTVSSVDSNFITNMSWSNSSSAEWYGIRIDAGLVEVGSTHGNTIGAATGTGSIYLEGGGTSVVPSYYGISTASTGNVKIENNIIASITTNRSNQGYATQFFGIHRTSGSTTNIENNTIGSASQANSIWSQSESNGNTTSSNQLMYGIYNIGSGTVNIVGNTIANLNNATNNTIVGRTGFVHGIVSSSGTNLIQGNNIHDLSIANANNNATTAAAMAGMMLTGVTVKSVRENTIYNLTNSFTDFTGSVYGIYFTGTTGTGNGVFRNFIHSLNVPNNTDAVSATIYGIRQVSSNVATLANNIVALDNDNTTLVYGIFDNATAGTANIYHNTVYVGGNPTDGLASSYALWANATAGVQDYRNNILYNEREGGSGTHYAIGLSGTTSLTIDNNNYYAGNTGVLGFLAGDQNTLADWQTATGQDGFSVDTDPDFDNGGGTLASDYMPNATNLTGNLFTGITDDYTGAARTVFSMGAFDVDVDPAVTVNASAGLATADYLTLTDAFNSINDGTHQGDIEVLINLGHNLNVSTVLNASGIGAADYTSVRVYPTEENILVVANIAAPMIDLNGANNVTIDGRVNGVSSGNPHALTLRNSNGLTTAGNSTIRFINGASNDTIQYVRIEGSTTATASGVIFLSTSTAPAGNNDNVIQHNLITNAGGNRAVNTLYSLGTAAKFNTGNKFENNEVFDFFRQQATSQGILIAGNNTEWTIRNNSFYETGTLAPTTTTIYTAIHLNSANIVNSVVSGNFIGGSQALAGGSAFTKTGNNNTFYGIRLSVGTSTVSAVDSNFITNMSWSNSSSAEWYGIRIDAGLVEVGSTHGNTIGAATGTGSVYIEGGSTTVLPSYYGISTASTSNVKIENNIIASITTNRSNQGYATQFFGIHRTAGSTTNIENNTIGSATQANSIWSQSESNGNTTSSNQLMYGIYNIGSGTVNIVGNTIANLNNATNNTIVGRTGFVHGIVSSSGTNLIQGNNIHDLSIANANNNATTAAAMAGMMLTGVTVKSVRENTIYNLTNSFTDFTGSVYGICFTGTTGTGNGVFRNFIHSLNVPNNTDAVSATIYGIRQVSSNVATLANNIVSLDNDNTALVYGIFDNASAGTANIYHNTIYVGGNPTDGAANSYALWANATAGVQDYKNNILYNERTGGSGTHYAIGLSGTTSLTIDNNNYYAGNTGVLGFLAGNQNTLADWQTATGQDGFSVDTDPDFDNAGGTLASDYMPNATNLSGNLFTSITDDFTGAARTVFSMGAFDVDVDPTVTVNASAGLATADYLTLTDAFNSINDGTHQGDIEVLINLGHNLNVSTILNASGVGAADYTSVRVYPTVENIVVVANIASPMIDLNGANNVTMDGRVNGVSSGTPHALTLRNINTSATAGNSTIRFINGASNDTIQYVRIEGSTTATASGVIFLSTSTAPAGNNDNVIQHNLITNAGGNRAVNTLYSLGTAAKFNTGNKFENNEVFDFFRQQATSQGILIAGNNTEWTIRNNSFYETGTLNPTTTTTYTAIYLNSANIVNSVVSGNFIGGSQALAGGSPFTKSGNNTTFYGIRTSLGATPSSYIDSNIITNMSWSNSSNAAWYGISHEAGSVNIGAVYGNTIGSSIGTGSIYLIGGGTTVIPDYFGIYITAASPAVVTLNNNIVASISNNRSNQSFGTRFYGVYKSGTSSMTAENNTIGSSTQANSIWSQSLSSLTTSTASEQRIYGICNAGTGAITLSGNLIANLTNATTNTGTAITGHVHGITSTGGVNTIVNNVIHNLSIQNANNTASNVSSLAGIMLTGTSVKSVTENTIYNLSNSFTDFTGSVYGIYFTGTTGANNGVFRNFIHGLNVPNNTGSVSATIYGIRQVSNGVANFQNNIVSLQNDNTANIFGLYDNGTTGTTNFQNNTVYIAGEPTSGSASSYALFSNAATAVQNFRNNILVNEREGGSGTHYSIRVAGTGTLTINQNLYRVSPTGVTGFLGSNQTTLADWQSATSQDQGSLDFDPQFVNAGSTVAADYLPQEDLLVGANIPSVVDDFSGAVRTFYAMGAWEYPVAYLWKGGGAGVPTDWNNALNWTPQAVPPSGFAVKFENNGNGHNLVLDQNRSAFFIDFNGSNKKVEVGNFDLTVSDDFTGADANNFVIAAGSGVLRRADLGNGESFVFPIGGSQYNPVTLTNNSGAADDFTARVLDAVYEGGLSGNVVDVPHLSVTWDLGKANPNGGSGLNFLFQWHVDQETDVMTDYALNHHNGTNWEIASGTTNAPVGATIKTMLHTGYTGGFSPFAVGPSFDSALPVELIGIQVNCLNEGKNAEITWQTASELNSDKFIIERSNDGLIWEAIGSVQGAGTTTQLSQYSFVDAQTRSSRVVYYRLTQVDFNGASRTYPPVSSDCEMTEEIVLFPNPAREQVFVQMINAQDENVRVEIRNQVGSLISARNYELIEGMNMLNMDINNLSAGQYFIVISSENKEPRMVKFIKSE